MLPGYEDIRDAITRAPDWFDANGVPRYAPFMPQMLGVYDKYALLVEIACQSCDERFLVGEGWGSYALHPEPRMLTLHEVAERYHYGDPPIHRDYCVGCTMNCVDIRIVEAWAKGDDYEWHRDVTVEALNIYPEWAR